MFTFQVQQELEKSIKDLLILQIMNKNSTKDQVTLNQMMEDKRKGVMCDHEYMDIVNYLYNEKDATQLRIILGIECQDAFDKRESGEVNPRSHFEFKNKNITNESDMKVKHESGVMLTQILPQQTNLFNFTMHCRESWVMSLAPAKTRRHRPTAP